jgi:putative ABC transport system ATP-binding protein
VTSPVVVRHLDHFYGEGDARRQALFDIDLEVARGSLTILMGASGSGKTTLLTLMGCLRTVQEGSLRLLGTELRGADEATQRALRQRLGFIFQAHNLHESLTATQNVLMGLQVHGRGDPRKHVKAAHHLLGLLGLAERVDYRPGQLSGGEKQRVAIARALVAGPEVVFADEPTAALDKASGLTVIRMLKALGQQRQVTTVMVTHDNRILELADRIIVMDDGALVDDQLVPAAADAPPAHASASDAAPV